MNILLIYFALPIATIILAIVLQKILKCPLLVAATFFAIYLIVVFAISTNATLLIYVILYSILAYVTAVLTNIICKIKCKFGNILNNNNCVCENNSRENTSIVSQNDGIGNCINQANLLSQNDCNRNNLLSQSRSSGCNCQERNSITTVTTTTGEGPLNTTSNTYTTGRNNVCTCNRICGRR